MSWSKRYRWRPGELRARYRWRPGELRAGCLSGLSFVLCGLAVFGSGLAVLERRWLVAGANLAASIVFGRVFTYWQPRTRGARLVRERRERCDVRK